MSSAAYDGSIDDLKTVCPEGPLCHESGAARQIDCAIRLCYHSAYALLTERVL
jgi:hypothetical protein